MRSYPLERLPRLSRERARALTAHARSAPLGALGEGGRRARGWLGVPIEVRWGSPVDWKPAAAPSVGAHVLLEGPGGRAGLRFGSALAFALVDRTLGAGESGATREGALGSVERGVLTYALARWLAGSGWRVSAIFAHPPALREALAEPPALCWPITLGLGEVSSEGELWLCAPPGSPPPPRARAPLPDVPVSIRIRAGRATLAVRDVLALAVGDVVVPEVWSAAWSEGGLSGTVRVEVAGSRLAWTARVEGPERLRLEDFDGGVLGDPSPVRRRRSEEMDDAIATMGDTPVVLHVELARLELRLADVAALSVGEVLATGQTLGTRVTLRAGDRAIATGELVDVDGELGIQIVEVATQSS